MDKAKIVIISLISALILFAGLIFMERKLVNYTPTMKVVYCIKDVNRKEALDASNFTLKDVPLTSVTIDTVRSLDDIKNMYAKENIYANEVLNKKRMGTQQDVNVANLNDNEREIAISFKTIDDAAGGIIRKDDKVDIIYTNNPTPNEATIKTRTLIENVKVLGVMDASGKLIDESDKNSVANTILFGVEPQIAHLLTNLQKSGELRLIKVPDNGAQYNNIIIIDGQIISY